MVKSVKVGKRRPFWRGLLLTIGTLGVYGIYWNYKAHHEVYSQFDLDDEGRDEAVIWLILGLVVLPPLMWVYQYLFVKNVSYVREHLALRWGLTAGQFIALIVSGAVAFALGVVGLQLLFLFFVLEPVDPGRFERFLVPAVTVASLLMLAGLALQMVAYYRLQDDINGVWDAYDIRHAPRRAPARPAAAAAWVPQPIA